MYTIHPLGTATMSDVVKGQIFTYLVDLDVAMTIPVTSYLVLSEDDGDDFVLLVDTGIDPERYAGDRDIERGGPEAYRHELSRFGLVPGDVDHVVMTHLHNDHVGNIELFADAEYLIQRAELTAARDPLPHMAFAYSPDTADRIVAVEPTLVDGGYRLREGIELLSTPGHTRGSQSVVVETGAERHAIVGDLGYCRHNFEPGISSILDGNGEEVAVTPTDAPYIPPGLHVDTEDCYESYERVRERIGEDGVVLGGHDAELLGRTFPEQNPR